MSRLNNQLSLSDEPETTVIATFCRICKSVAAQYKCPKCSIDYCSVTCYQSHSSNCTEQFYKEQVCSHLKGIKGADPEVADILRTNLEEREKDADDLTETDSEYYADLLNKLERNQEDFSRAMGKSDWENFDAWMKLQKTPVDRWKAWWEGNHGDLDIVTEVLNDAERDALLKINACTSFETDNGDDELSEDSLGDLISIENNLEEMAFKHVVLSIKLRYFGISKVSALTRIKPNMTVVGSSLVNVLGCGTYLLRRYNGDLLVDADEATGLLIFLCPVLHVKKKVFYTTEMAVIEVIEQANKMLGVNEKLSRKGVIDDVFQVIKSKLAAVILLLQLYDLMATLSNDYKSKLNKTIKTKLGSAKMKILYLVGFIKEFWQEEFVGTIQKSLTKMKQNNGSLYKLV